jgi:hypothetical protein
MSRVALVPSRAVTEHTVMKETGQSSALLESDLDEELCRTWMWRFDQFTKLGFEPRQAAQMADAQFVDLAQARRLINLGCPLETASRILL